ncbi:MAG: threonine/serine exporter family protein [Flavobacteriaceae bacterium]|nr:threonine/serine exporter family protein [Flavobacteriaceae bacterium]
MKIPKKYQFIIQLGKALHAYGVPSHKIQRYLKQVSKRKNISGSFMDSPTRINYVFYDKHTEESFSYLECVDPGQLNLGAMARVVEVAERVQDKSLDFEVAKRALTIIAQKTNKVNHLILILAYTCGAAAFSLLLGTNWISCLVSFLMGGIVYLLNYLSSKFTFINNTFEALASFIVSILIGVLSLYFPTINVPLTILAAIIILIPGMAITTALEEITYKSLVSGSAKFFDAFMSLFKQFFGVLLAFSIFKMVHDIDIVRPVVNNIPKWATYLGIPLLSFCLLPIFQVRRKDVLFSVLTCIISYSISVLFSFSGILLSTFIGSLTVVLVSNLFSRITGSPRLVYITQGIIMLVPGSKAFIGISSVFLDTPVQNTESIGMQVAYILMGVIGGLLFSGPLNTK